jgi:hypothetical protein
MSKRNPKRSLVAATLLTSMFAGCLDRPLDTAEPRTTSTVVERITRNGVEKIDLLLVIDNSISMADKQEILAAAVPALVKRLVTPRCLLLDGVTPTGESIDATGSCPDGSRPEFAPVRDINIGVISSSLGGALTGCADGPETNDGAHLLDRVPEGSPAPNFVKRGVLNWDPDDQREGGEADVERLARDVGNLVRGAGQNGCAYEMQLEAAYRFLADPAPPRGFEVVDDRLQPAGGVDQELLEERASFLRPDSLVATLILSDENDCSFNFARQPQELLREEGHFRSTSECATDPTDACCRSCEDPVPTGCDAEGACRSPKYTPDEDPHNLKCWQQMERYGVDYLFPVERYVNAFSRPRIAPDHDDLSLAEGGDSVANPLFVAPDGTERRADLVFVAGIVGVPWQALANTNAAGEPDLAVGLKDSEALEDLLPALVGNPDAYVPPTDPFMIESMAPRTGVSPIVGASLPGDNVVNGGDYDQGERAELLQHACTFELPMANEDVADDDNACRRCDDTVPGCAGCPDVSCSFPLCDENVGTTQKYAKAYPGLRQLALLRRLGRQATIASICPAKTSGDETASDFGYNPAVNQLVDSLSSKLQSQCLPRELVPNDEGQVSCLVVEAFEDDDCSCALAGRSPIPETLESGEPNPTFNAVREIQRTYGNQCFCEITQLTEATGQSACLNELDPDASSQGDGFCYVDASVTPPVGNPALVADCTPNERRLLRFVGEGQPRSGATAFITCSGE